MSNFNPKVLLFKGFRLRVTSAGHLPLPNPSALLCFVLHNVESKTWKELEISGEDLGIYIASELWWPRKRLLWHLERQESVSLLQRKVLQLPGPHHSLTLLNYVLQKKCSYWTQGIWRRKKTPTQAGKIAVIHLVKSLSAKSPWNRSHYPVLELGTRG